MRGVQHRELLLVMAIEKASGLWQTVRWSVGIVQRPEGNNMLLDLLQYLAIYLFLRLHMLASVSEIAFSSKQSNYFQLPQGVQCQCVRYLFRITFASVFIARNFHNHSHLTSKSFEVLCLFPCILYIVCISLSISCSAFTSTTFARQLKIPQQLAVPL